MDEATVLEELRGLVLEVAAQRYVETTLHRLVRAASRLLDCKEVAVLVVDPESEYLVVKSQIGLSATFADNFRREVGTGTLGEVLWAGRTRVFADRDEQEREGADITLERPAVSASVAPLASGFKILGVLHASSDSAGHFTPERVQLLDALVGLAAIAMEKQALMENCQQLQRTDELTGLLNHGAFFERLQEEERRSRRTGLPLSILLMDVDNMKAKRGTYGTPGAHKLLKHIGKVITDIIRCTDCAARYGTDEFGVILPATDADGAGKISETIRSDIARTQDDELSSTVSIGAVSTAPGALGVREIVEQLKVAVFKAQRSGRNRVVLVDRTKTG